jgi:hypothetical protein
MRLNLVLGLAAAILLCGGGCGQDDDSGPTPNCITQGCDQDLPRVAAQAPRHLLAERAPGNLVLAASARLGRPE